jgi:hypothetical protein
LYVLQSDTEDIDEDIEDTELPEIATMEDISTHLRSGTLQSPAGNVAQEKTVLSDISTMNQSDLDSFWEYPNVTLFSIPVLLAKFICFLPWCIAVGAAILLCPNRMELFAFAPGYQTSPTGIHRFAYWADCAKQHVAIFFAFMAYVWMYNGPLGVSLAAGVLAGFVYSWRDFVLNRSIPLGNDDQQSIYLVFANYGLDREASLVLQKNDMGYFVLDRNLVGDVDSVDSQRL